MEDQACNFTVNLKAQDADSEVSIPMKSKDKISKLDLEKNKLLNDNLIMAPERISKKRGSPENNLEKQNTISEFGILNKHTKKVTKTNKWRKEEYEMFKDGRIQFGENCGKISNHIGTKSIGQVISLSKKLKLKEKLQIKKINSESR